MEDKLKLLADSLGRLKYNESLRYHTFTKSSGMAQSLYIATNLKELLLSLNSAFNLEVPIFLIGSGTKISNADIKGIIIKNRARLIKISSIKGKVGVKGINLEEASVEVESGATFEELNKFLIANNLAEFAYADSLKATIGGSINLNPYLKQIIQKVKVWEQGEIETIEIGSLNLQKQIVLSIIAKFKASK